jgi:general secretion pathway protein D
MNVPFRLLMLVYAVAALTLGAATPVEPDYAGAKVALLSQALLARDAGDLVSARQHLEALLALRPGDSTVRALLAGLDQRAEKQVRVSGGVVAADEAAVLAQAEATRQDRLLAEARVGVQEARALLARGERAAALAVIGRAGAELPHNPRTEPVWRELAEIKAAAESTPMVNAPVPTAGETKRTETTAAMVSEVGQAWRRPEQPAVPPPAKMSPTAPSGLAAALDRIVLPTVNFSGLELSRVVNTLSALSEEYDAGAPGAKGVNIVLHDQGGTNPKVNLTLRGLPLRRVLDLVTAAVGYQYELEADAVVVRPAGGAVALDTAFFAVARSTVLRLTGRSAGEVKPGTTVESEGAAIRSFLQLAGVVFDGVPGASLAFDGSQLIVTQTPRNLGRVENILRRYSAVRQVEIEAKFMEVQQGALEQLGVEWSAATKASQVNAGAQAGYGTANRTLADAFRNATTTQQITVTGTGSGEGGLALPAAAPTIPGGVLLGAGANPLANITGVVGEFDVNAVVRALSQQSGTELLSAPKLTVLSGNQATITVAQEMRYPQSYGQIQSQVGTGSISGGGSAGVSITSGTPQEFTSRNVGVELKVTPTVEEDDYSVSLDLNPKVTEFEGFVEYGGPSIAISGGTTVTVPPGFYQPIFAVREVTTRVTLWDGATLMMGGLTREEVKKVNDKVPVLGSLPLIGRLFRSKGESTQKRNLLIFVTANLVNPGGGRTRSGPATTAAGK